MKQSLAELETKKLELQFELQNLTSKRRKRSTMRSSVENSKSSPAKRSIEKRKLDRNETKAFVTDKIMQSDIIDMQYYKELIEDEYRRLIEKMKIHQPILKYIWVSSSQEHNSQTRNAYSVRRTLAELMQEKYRNSIKTDVTIDLEGYVIELKKLKVQIADRPRESRSNMTIHILNHIKTNMDYKRNNILIGNPRNPFIRMDWIDYDLDR